MIQFHARFRSQGAAQFVAFAIIAGETDRINLSDSQSGQIVQDGSCSAGLAAHVDDVVDRQTGLDRDFRTSGIDFQVTVEAEITYHRHGQAWILLSDGIEAVWSHGDLKFMEL